MYLKELGHESEVNAGMRLQCMNISLQHMASFMGVVFRFMCVNPFKTHIEGCEKV
jgi:hypothetical protein